MRLTICRNQECSLQVYWFLTDQEPKRDYLNYLLLSLHAQYCDYTSSIATW